MLYNNKALQTFLVVQANAGDTGSPLVREDLTHRVLCATTPEGPSPRALEPVLAAREAPLHIAMKTQCSQK